MSGDDIVFGEMKLREPGRLTRPDRDRRYACVAYEVPAPIDLPIFLDRRTADAIERHALSDTSVELGGILLGKECLDPGTGQPFVWITQSLEAKHYANTQASFTYTHDSWEEITRERDRLHPDCDIVGWYHTHPSFGIFLSHHDLFIHQHFFAQPLQVAYVVDPINQTRGFFQWRDGGLAQVGGYHLIAPRGDRVALARLANDLEQLPNPEGSGGGGLSPRLEAELIKMLSRPAHSQMASPTERLQLAAVSGMLGTLVGILAVALVFWLYQLQGRIQEQGEDLDKIAYSLERLGVGQLATDTLLRKSGVPKPEEFQAQYNKAAEDLAKAQRLLEIQRSISDDLGARAKDLAGKLEAAQKELGRTSEDAREAPELRKRVAKLEESKQQYDDLEAYLETKDGKATRDIHRELVRTRYLSYLGWGLCALLAMGLAAAFFYYKPTLPEPIEPETDEGERPTHRIV